MSRLICEGNIEIPELAIEWDGVSATYFVGDDEVPAEVYRDVVATRQAISLRTVERACDHINWEPLGELLERLGNA